MRITWHDSNDTPSTSRSEFVTLEQIPEDASSQPPIGPPEGSNSLSTTIFWNEREFRAGWRLLIYFFFVVIFTLAGTFLLTILHLPQSSRSGFTATSMLIQEAVGIAAAFAAAAIMGMFEGRLFGDYGLPRNAAFGARFWQGAAWGIAMIAAIIFLIRAFGGFSFGDLVLRGPVLWGYAALWGCRVHPCRHV